MRCVAWRCRTQKTGVGEATYQRPRACIVFDRVIGSATRRRTPVPTQARHPAGADEAVSDFECMRLRLIDADGPGLRPTSPKLKPRFDADAAVDCCGGKPMLGEVSLNLLPALIQGRGAAARKECCPIFIKSCLRGHLVNMSCDMFNAQESRKFKRSKSNLNMSTSTPHCPPSRGHSGDFSFSFPLYENKLTTFFLGSP